MSEYSQMVNELKLKNNEIYNLLNDTKIYCENEINRSDGNLVLINNPANINVNSYGSNSSFNRNNRYNNIQNKNYYNSMDIIGNNRNFNLNNKNLDLMKDMKEAIEHSGLNMYQILSDYKNKENADCIDIKDIPIALKKASIDTNVEEVNNLLDVVYIPRNNKINIKDLLIKVLLYKLD